MKKYYARSTKDYTITKEDGGVLYFAYEKYTLGKESYCKLSLFHTSNEFLDIHNHVSTYFKFRGLCVQKSPPSPLTWLGGRKQYQLMSCGEKI
jgi:hypothetical protein